MRIAIVQNAPEEYVFVWNHHHLLLDGWTQAVIIHDLLTLYQAKAEGRSISLPEAQPYRNYISWLLSQDKGAAEDFWRSALAGFNTPVHCRMCWGNYILAMRMKNGWLAGGL